MVEDADWVEHPQYGQGVAKGQGGIWKNLYTFELPSSSKQNKKEISTKIFSENLRKANWTLEGEKSMLNYKENPMDVHSESEWKHMCINAHEF